MPINPPVRSPYETYPTASPYRPLLLRLQAPIYIIVRLTSSTSTKPAYRLIDIGAPEDPRTTIYARIRVTQVRNVRTYAKIACERRDGVHRTVGLEQWTGSRFEAEERIEEMVEGMGFRRVTRVHDQEGWFRGLVARTGEEFTWWDILRVEDF